MSVTMTVSLYGRQVSQVENIPFTANMNVQQAMEAAYALTPGHTYNFSLQYFGTGLGYEVVTLDSIVNQMGSDLNSYVFWALYINGRFSPTGIDETILHDDDQIGWDYQSYSPELHGGTRYEKARNAARARFA
jgi:hypothetical protein